MGAGVRPSEGAGVLVIGAGVAGAAAAWAAARLGCRVTILADGIGATGQSSGAWDWEPWRFQARGPERWVEREGTPAGAVDEVRSFLGAVLDAGWGVVASPSADLLGAGPRWLATGAGCLRPAAASDPCLLDLGLVPRGGLVLLADLGRSDFRAALLARALAGEAEGRWRFEGLALPGLFTPAELALPLAAFRRCLAGGRLRDVLERVRAEALGRGASGVLLGPWLGDDAETGLLRREGMLVGETTSPPEGPAGTRLVRALRLCLAEVGVSVVSGRVSHLRTERAGVWAEPQVGRFEQAILATGGLVGAGVTLGHQPGTGWTSSLAPEAFDGVGSMRGFDGARDDGRFLGPGQGPGCDPGRLPHRLAAAGDVRARAPLSILGALSQGLAAGRRAAQLALAATSAG